MKFFNALVLTLLIVGGLNWGLIGLFDFDVVASIFGGPLNIISRVIYTIIGACAVYSIVLLKPATEIDTHHHTGTLASR